MSSYTTVAQEISRPDCGGCSGLFADRGRVLRIVNGEEPGVLLCVLPPENPEVDRGFRGGRIPGSATVPAAGLVEPGRNTFAFVHGNVVEVRPPLPITSAAADHVLAVLAEVLAEVTVR